MSTIELFSCFLEEALGKICRVDGDSIYLLRQLKCNITATGRRNVAIWRIIAPLDLSLRKPRKRILRRLEASEFVCLFGTLLP